MASGRIRDTHFRMERWVTTQHTEWFTPATGFTVSQCTIRHVERNIWFVYISGSFATSDIEPYVGIEIGRYTKSFFGGYPVTGMISALCTATGTNQSRAGVLEFQQSGGDPTSGSIVVSGVTQATASVVATGFVVSREI